jgi:hypothetical protein
MLRKAAAGLAALGLIGGAGSVVYANNGDATVKITNQKTGKAQSVRLRSVGDGYLCPEATHDKLKAHDIKLGRIKLTWQPLRREARKLEREYPQDRQGVRHAPRAVVDRYNAIIRRDDQLVAAYNAEVHARNAMADRECKPDAKGT